MNRVTEADRQLAEVRRRLTTAGIAVLAVFAVGVAGYMVIGHGKHRFLDSLYMTVITLTTVGYGEIIPMDDNPAGRIFTMVLILFGMGILVYFASTITAFFVEGQLEHVFWRKRMRRAIAELEHHVIVCGAGVVAGHFIDEMLAARRPVVAVVPQAGALPPLAAAAELLYVVGEASDEEVLAEAGIARAAGLVAALESDRDNVLVTLTARQAGAGLRIVAMLVDDRNESKLRRAGADAVVSPFRIGGMRMASEMIRPMVVTFLDKMLRDRDRNLRVEELRVGRGSPAIGKSVGDIDVNAMPGLLLLALLEPGTATWSFKPDPRARIAEGATLIVMGDPAGVGELRSRYGGEAYAVPSGGPAAPVAS
ncbi:MAG TPA: NAD-binding protein [Gemmatimonadales bacterium]|nr:NAD-binding protein [Gemmatimonadales bacterium]